MNDTISSSFGRVSLNPSEGVAAVIAQNRVGVREVTSAGSPASSDKQGNDDDPKAPSPFHELFYGKDLSGSSNQRALTDADDEGTGILPFDGKKKFTLGVREEKNHIESMQSEIFQLKLKITLLEKNAQLGTETKDVYTQLTQTHALKRELEVENAALRKRVEVLGKQNRLELAEDEREQVEKLRDHEREAGELTDKVQAQDEMLQTFLDAQDEYSGILDDILAPFFNERLSEYAPEGIEDAESLDAKLVGVAEVVKKLVDGLDHAHEQFQRFEDDLETYISVRDEADRRAQHKEKLLSRIAAQFLDTRTEDLPDRVAELMVNKDTYQRECKELRLQNYTMTTRLAELESSTDAGLRSELKNTKEELQSDKAEIQRLSEILTRTSARCYEITRQFFRRLAAHMGSEWCAENEAKLMAIMEKAQRTSKSKLPMLVELMMQNIDEVATLARSVETLPAEKEDLEEKNKHLEGILTQELARLGADSVLLARYRDLENRLKIEKERRKNEYKGYERSLKNLTYH